MTRSDARIQQRHLKFPGTLKFSRAASNNTSMFTPHQRCSASNREEKLGWVARKANLREQDRRREQETIQREMRDSWEQAESSGGQLVANPRHRWTIAGKMRKGGRACIFQQPGPGSAEKKEAKVGVCRRLSPLHTPEDGPSRFPPEFPTVPAPPCVLRCGFDVFPSFWMTPICLYENLHILLLRESSCFRSKLRLEPVWDLRFRGQSPNGEDKGAGLEWIWLKTEIFVLPFLLNFFF